MTSQKKQFFETIIIMQALNESCPSPLDSSLPKSATVRWQGPKISIQCSLKTVYSKNISIWLQQDKK